ncbi:MAG: hypothetical protein M1371_06455 [Actinobacteria bacterium]|nr:hypothetical protein [Actinomycetota bacterium]
MNSFQRVVAALNLKLPDIVPTFEWDIHPCIIKSLMGSTDLFDFVERFGLDGLTISWGRNYLQIDENIFVDEWGIKRAQTQESHKIAIDGPIKTISDLGKLDVPDPLDESRFDDLKNAVSRFKNKKFLIFALNDVFSLPRDLMGYENFLVGLYDSPSLIRSLVELSYEFNLSLGKKAKEIGADGVVMGDDIADNLSLLLSPRLYTSMFYPAFKKLISGFKEAGLYVIKHTDGNINEVMDLIVDSGIDCLDPIDPLGGMDIKNVKEKYGNKIALKGNVNCATTLVFGTEEDVEKEVIKIIDECASGGGLIVSSSNCIHASVKPQNYLAMLRTIKKYGKVEL